MKQNNTSVLTLPSVLSLAMLVMLLAAIVVLAQAPDYMFDPERAPYSRQHDSITAPDELTQRFEEAVMMLHAKKYEYAVAALHRVIQLAPRMPEAYANMGYALLGLQRYRAAHDFFKTASDLDPYQANAYWGLAVTLEQTGDLHAAVGAMRTYIHLAKPGDPYVRRARSAIWEWETQLARGPLPENEKQFLERGMRQWEDRNKPQHDIQESEKNLTHPHNLPAE